MRKLAHLSNQDLIDQMTQTRKSELKNAADILIYIDEVSHRRIHLAAGFSSIYKFLREKFRYSKDESYARVRAAQTFFLNPKIEKALRENKTCITYLMQAQVAFNREDKRLKAINQPKLSFQTKREVLNRIIENREAKRTLATAFPSLQKDFNSEKPVTAELTVYQFSLDKEAAEKLKRVKELNSHTVPDGNLSDLVSHLLTEFLKRHDQKPKKPADQTKTQNQRKHISIHTKRELHENAHHQCEFTSSNGTRCAETFGLQIEHTVPIARGGTDSYDNLKILCREHNRYAAELHNFKRPEMRMQ